MLHCNKKTQELALAKVPPKKPVPPRTPAVRKEKVVAAPVGEGASPKVEWPLDAAKAKKNPEKLTVPPQAQPVSEPAPIVEQPAAPVIAEAVAPIAEETVIPEPAFAAAEPTKGIPIMTDAIETAKTYAEEAKTRFQGAVAEMNEKAKAAVEKSTKAVEELSDLTKGNFDAIVESSKIAAKGLETLGQEAVEFSRKSFEKSTATFKSFAAIKTPAEFFQLQSELLSSSLDSFASETAKNSEAVLKLVGDVSKPISNRVAIVTDKVKTLAA
ncbi:MAG: phasin family protein [Sphingobium sp.]|nr:phasin family protein [Sphingobium sp.]